VARLLNRVGVIAFTLGIAPNYLVTLDVLRRVSNRVISLSLVMAVVGGERYLVSMLGTNANWVRNVQAAHGASPCDMGGASRYIWKRPQ
jgi:hypothetical protein